jgi:hypothetical protein
MRTLIGLSVVFSAALSVGSSASEMWSCSVGGTTGNKILLVDMGPRSYVKLSGQRVPATVTVTGEARRWVWGENSIVLDSDGLAQYYEGGDTETVKATFRCRRMG